MEITIYFVGESPEDALERFCFDSYESADSYQMDNPGTHIYAATAVVDTNSLYRTD